MRVWPLLNRRCPDTTWRARVVRSQSELPTPDEVGAEVRAVRVRGRSDRSGSMSAGAPAIPAPGPFPSSHAPPIGQLRVARRPNRPPGGPLRAFQPQGHTPTTPLKTPSTPFPSATGSARSTAPALGPAVSQPSPGPAIEGTRDPSSRCCSAQFTAARLRAVGRVQGCSDRSGGMSAGAPAIPAPGPFPGSHAPPIGQLRVARRPNRPPGGPLRAFQPQGHTPTTPLKPLSTPFPSAADSARSTAPPPTSIRCGRSVDDMARHAPHRCRIARNPTPVHSALGERLTYRLLQVQRSLSKESQTSAVTCPPQPHNSASRDDQPRPRSLTTTSHPPVSGVLRYGGDLQHRSGQPAHQYRVHGAAAGSGRALFAGRSRSLSGQCVHQAVFIKRLWRSLQYEAVYLRQLADGFMAQRVIDERSSSPTRCDRARHWMVGRRRPPTAGLRRPDRRWRTGHGGQVAIAGSDGTGPAGAQSGDGSYPQCPPDQAPRPRAPTPFYRHLFLTARGALTITRIYLDLPPGGGPNLPLPTSIEMTPDASAVVTFHRNHWKGSPEYAIVHELLEQLGADGCQRGDAYRTLAVQCGLSRTVAAASVSNSGLPRRTAR